MQGERTGQAVDKVVSRATYYLTYLLKQGFVKKSSQVQCGLSLCFHQGEGKHADIAGGASLDWQLSDHQVRADLTRSNQRNRAVLLLWSLSKLPGADVNASKSKYLFGLDMSCAWTYGLYKWNWNCDGKTRSVYQSSVCMAVMQQAVLGSEVNKIIAARWNSRH